MTLDEAKALFVGTACPYPEAYTGGCRMNDYQHRDGNAVIDMGGFHPNEGFAYEYTSGRHHFWFYCRVEGDESAPRAVIHGASSARFAGPTPKFSKEDLAEITNNIRQFFAAKSYNEVTFTWGTKR